MMICFTSESTILPNAAADDHAHGEVDHVAFQGEVLEFLEQRQRAARVVAGRPAI